MNIRNIKEIAAVMEKSGLTLVEVTEGETTLRLERAPAVVPAAAVQPAASAAPAASAPAAEEKPAVDFNHVTEVTSPLVGVVYLAPSPDSPPFVTVGSKVKKGDVLCIVEAMKVMNEITSDVDGEVVDICAENGQLVEFSQVLFKIY